MQVFGLTDKGRVRKTNEDNFAIVGFDGVLQTSVARGINGQNTPDLGAGQQSLAYGGVCVVADGMGGHNAGEIASGETVKIVSSELQSYIGKNLIAQNVKVLMVSGIKNANTMVRKLAEDSPGRDGMGTTVVAAHITDDAVYIANVGDSRAYIVNANEIKQITKDHSLVENLIEDGTITREEAKTHPRKHVITRAIGTDEDILTDVFEYKYQKGRDTLILCSDGLTEMLDDNEIFDIVNANDYIKLAVQSLVNKANQLGGADNITVVGVRL